MSTSTSRVAVVLFGSLLALAAPARAAGAPALLAASGRDPWKVSWQTAPAPLARAWHIEWLDPGLAEPNMPSLSPADPPQQPGATRPRAKAFEYSDAYNLRRKIHVYASIATAPLFVTEWVLGQKLYNGTGGESVRSAHRTVATGIGVLFGVNTVTGVWNLMEARKDPNHRTKRMVHGILMLAADGGFLATGLTAPSREDFGDTYMSKRSTHRTIAIASVGLATAGYLMMLIGR